MVVKQRSQIKRNNWEMRLGRTSLSASDISMLNSLMLLSASAVSSQSELVRGIIKVQPDF
jgi:hypothetical protein